MLAATFLVYLRALSNGFVFDDREEILANRLIGERSFIWKSLFHDLWWFRDPLHLPQSAYYRPLHDLWLALNFHLFGFEPSGWHAMMVLLHLGVVMLGFRLALVLTGDVITSLVCAGLFGLMPVHAEAISWPAALPEPLAALFEIAALNCFIVRRRGARGMPWPSLLLFAGALLSHESAITFPLLLAAYVFLSTQGSGQSLLGAASANQLSMRARVRCALVASIPFLLVAAGYLALRIAVLGFITRPNPANHASLAQVLVTIPAVLSEYLSILIVPWLAAPAHRVLMTGVPAVATFYVPTVGLFSLALAGYLLARASSGARLYGFCAVWVMIGLAPMLNLGGLMQQALVQDRYLYLPSFALALVVADAAIRVGRRSRPLRTTVAAGLSALALIYAGALWHVEGYWHDEIALFSRGVAIFPEAAIYHNRLALALEARGDLIDAEQQLNRALELEADPATLYDLGLLHQQLGRKQEAAGEIHEALSKLPNAPADPWVNLATLYDAIGFERERDAAFAQARLRPDGQWQIALARARNSLERGDPTGAEELLRSTITREPNNSRAHLALASVLAIQHRYTEAITECEHAERLAPGDSAAANLMSQIRSAAVARPAR